MRCKHNKNVTITEFGTSYTQHSLEGDQQWWHESDYDGYTGEVEVICDECGLNKRYKNRKPKWLLKLLKEATGHDVM